jgi:hypothetical protein
MGKDSVEETKDLAELPQGVTCGMWVREVRGGPAGTGALVCLELEKQEPIAPL